MTAPFETSPMLAALPGIRHGFFGRNGGKSIGAFASNNMSISTGDDPETVAYNRRNAAAAIGDIEPNLCLVRQTHSSTVRVITQQPDDDVLVEADAMVSNLGAISLGILTADCTPILFADPDAGIIGAAHAGWRGAVDGIIGNTVAAMVQLGAQPNRIVAAFGPTVTAPNYEVGDQFRADFLKLHPTGERFFVTPPGGKPHFDLPAFVIEQLNQSAIDTVDRVGTCTYGSPDRYFSHRYATHQGTTTGRQISIIGRA
jgi:YfiH family protein